MKLFFISFFPCFKVHEWVQNGAKEATFKGTVCDDPNFARRVHDEENSRKAEYFLQWCEVHFAMPERNWLRTTQEKSRKTHENLSKARQAPLLSHQLSYFK